MPRWPMLVRSVARALLASAALAASCQPTLAVEAAGVAPCGVPYEPSPLTSMAHALISPRTGQPVIIYSPRFIDFAERGGWGAAVFRYLLQHECGHHVLGHVSAVQARRRRTEAGLQRSFELEADCYAARQLFAGADEAALRTAILLWRSVGEAATGPGYPTGNDRAAMLESCFAPDGTMQQPG